MSSEFFSPSEHKGSDSGITTPGTSEAHFVHRKEYHMQGLSALLTPERPTEFARAVTDTLVAFAECQIRRKPGVAANYVRQFGKGEQERLIEAAGRWLTPDKDRKSSDQPLSKIELARLESWKRQYVPSFIRTCEGIRVAHSSYDLAAESFTNAAQ